MPYRISMPPLIKIENLSKSFGGIHALSAVHFEVLPGEVHALVGENGAGKSTLIKILMGVYHKDGGSIIIDDIEAEIRNPAKAKELGLAAVYQDVMLARHLSVGENFFMGSLPLKGGLVDWNLVFRRTDEFLAGLGIAVDSRHLVSELTIARQQLVAIAKVVWQGARVIIFDEPTALLTNAETDMLFEIIRRLSREGKSIVYISHRMEEIFAICNRVTVLKDGRYVATLPIAETNKDQIVSLMVGRNVVFPARNYRATETVLEVKNLSSARHFADISFSVCRGEIFGIYGLVGAGRTQLIHALFGADRYDSGEILLNGKAIRPRSPMNMIKRGFGLVCEDRKQQSLALPLDVKTNLNLIHRRQSTRFGFLRPQLEAKITSRFIQALNIKADSPYQKVANLSGGNQQKVVIGKWLSIEPQILFFDEPTIGVDVGARFEIYNLLQKLIDDGKTIIMISSYLPEVIAIADRILVMREGRSMGVVEHREATEEKLLRMASGLEKSANASSEQAMV
jgi:ribose transport system ATP-binding protein